MKTGLWIARRFSFARKRFRVINVISAISLAGIIIGVSTLLVVMSVLNGFQKLARDLFITIDSPAQIVPVNGRTLTVSDTLLQAIKALEGVGAVEPYAEGEAIMGSGEKSELVVVKGLSEAAHRRLILQTHATHPYFTGETIAAGEILAYRTNLHTFRQVKIFSPELISLGLESLSQPYLIPMLGIPETTVSSIFSLQKIFDDRYVLTSDSFAHKILLLGRGEYSGIDIRQKEGYSRDDFTISLRKWLAASPMKASWKIRTLEEKYTNIFTVMQLECPDAHYPCRSPQSHRCTCHDCHRQTTRTLLSALPGSRKASVHVHIYHTGRHDWTRGNRCRNKYRRDYLQTSGTLWHSAAPFKKRLHHFSLSSQHAP